MIAEQASGTQTRIFVDFADMKCTNNPYGRIVSATLGSCIGVAIYDPEMKIGGILQYMLPDSHLNRERALANPYIFADTGIPLLFRRSYKLGGLKQRMIVKLAGGASVIDPRRLLEFGRLNIEAAKKILGNNGVEVHGDYLGGRHAMTLILSLDTGRTVVKLANGEEVDI